MLPSGTGNNAQSQPLILPASLLNGTNSSTGELRYLSAQPGVIGGSRTALRKRLGFFNPVPVAVVIAIVLHSPPADIPVHEWRAYGLLVDARSGMWLRRVSFDSIFRQQSMSLAPPLPEAQDSAVLGQPCLFYAL